MRSFLLLLAIFSSPLLGGNTWLRMQMGIISPAPVAMLQDAIKEAEAASYQGIIVQLDTPGGSLQATREIVQLLLTSPVPIVVWVAPGGAHAASAGAFITMGGHSCRDVAWDKHRCSAPSAGKR